MSVGLRVIHSPVFMVMAQEPLRETVRSASPYLDANQRDGPKVAVDNEGNPRGEDGYKGKQIKAVFSLSSVQHVKLCYSGKMGGD
jgi:hypothetical protein